MGPRPIFSHNFPPGTTIWIAKTHCQRVKLKKTRPDSDLGHILCNASKRPRRVCFESNSYTLYLNYCAGAKSHDRRLKSAIVSLKGRFVSFDLIPAPRAAPAPLLRARPPGLHARPASGYRSRARSALVDRARQRSEKSRPLSRVLSWTVIPLGCASPRSSGDLPGSPM